MEEGRTFEDAFLEYQNICWALGVDVDKFMEPRPPEGVSA